MQSNFSAKLHEFFVQNPIWTKLYSFLVRVPLYLRFSYFVFCVLAMGNVKRKLISHEDWIKNELTLKENWTFLDVGAHYGEWAIWAADKVKQVIAIEPERTTCSILRRNIRHMKNVKVLNIAIYDRTSFMDMKIGSHGFGFVTVQRNAKKKSIAVFATSIDDLATSMQLEVNMLKVDVEGSELYVLKGAQRTLQSLELAVIEFHKPEYRQKIIDIFSGYGFNVTCKGDKVVASR